MNKIIQEKEGVSSKIIFLFNVGIFFAKVISSFIFLVFVRRVMVNFALNSDG